MSLADKWVPFTPGGSCLAHLARSTEDEAWKALMHEARHMPYNDKEAFVKRGYTVEQLKEVK